MVIGQGILRITPKGRGIHLHTSIDREALHTLIMREPRRLTKRYHPFVTLPTLTSPSILALLLLGLHRGPPTPTLLDKVRITHPILSLKAILLPLKAILRHHTRRRPPALVLPLEVVVDSGPLPTMMVTSTWMEDMNRQPRDEVSMAPLEIELMILFFIRPSFLGLEIMPTPRTMESMIPPSMALQRDQGP